MKASLEVKGTSALFAHIERAISLEAVKKVVSTNTSEMANQMQRRAPVDTGFMRRSINQSILDGGLSGMVTPTAEYTPYVNFGTRFQAAQPFVSNAFNYQKIKFLADMKGLVR